MLPIIITKLNLRNLLQMQGKILNIVMSVFRDGANGYFYTD